MGFCGLERLDWKRHVSVTWTMERQKKISAEVALCLVES